MSDPQPAKRSLVLFLLMVLATRVPFLLPGYGPDADSWLVAHSAVQLWSTGHYTPSRLPGYPLHEIISAPLVSLGGPLLSNSATMIVSLIALAVWWKIARRRARTPPAAIAALTFSPLFWNSSVVTIDYVWSLLFILLAFDTIDRDGYSRGGLFLGFAVGFRPANGIALLPFVLLIILRSGQIRPALRFCAAATLTTILCYAPLLVSYGPGGWMLRTAEEMRDVHPSMRERLLQFAYRSIWAIGPAALAVILAVVFQNRHVLRQQLDRRDAVALFSMAMTATTLALFLALPIERAYLLPALPFLILLVDRIARPRQSLGFAIALGSLAFVNPDIAGHGDTGPLFHPAIRPGRLAELWTERREFLEARRQISTWAYPPRSIVLTGGDITFWFENDLVFPDSSLAWGGPGRVFTRSVIRPDIRFVAALTADQLSAARQEGFEIVCPEPARRYVERQTGTTLEDLGIVPVRFPVHR